MGTDDEFYSLVELDYTTQRMVCLPAATVPVHSSAEAHLVQRRDSHQETGARALHRVPLHGPLQAQCRRSEDAAHQMAARIHRHGDPAGHGGQAHAKWPR